MPAGWVFLCPGQGSQYVGMGKALHDEQGRARELFARANDVLGMDLTAIAFEGPVEELTKTHNTQPAVYVVDVVCAAMLRDRGVRPAAAAGHSLGEYAACAVAGALTFDDGLRLTRLRGELMYAAGIERPGAMAAVIGLEESAVEAALQDIPGTVVAANLNTPTQIVISGDVESVETAMLRLKEGGARRVVRLPVSGAFHSPLMEPAARGLEQALSRTVFRPAEVPVVANVSGQPSCDPGVIRDALIKQLTSRVRWTSSMRYLLDSGHRRFVESGPGTALQGMLRQIDRSVTVQGVDTPQTLDAFLNEANAGSAG